MTDTLQNKRISWKKARYLWLDSVGASLVTSGFKIQNQKIIKTLTSICQLLLLGIAEMTRAIRPSENFFSTNTETTMWPAPFKHVFVGEAGTNRDPLLRYNNAAAVRHFSYQNGDKKKRRGNLHTHVACCCQRYKRDIVKATFGNTKFKSAFFSQQK